MVISSQISYEYIELPENALVKLKFDNVSKHVVSAYIHLPSCKAYTEVVKSKVTAQ